MSNLWAWIKYLFGHQKSDELTLQGLNSRLTAAEQAIVRLESAPQKIKELTAGLKASGDSLNEAESKVKQ